jgi:hypothetical protein
MEDNKKKCPYEQVTGKLDTIDVNLLKAQKEIMDLVNRMKKNVDVCPDEQDSEKALQEALDNYFIEELTKAKPVGEA